MSNRSGGPQPLPPAHKLFEVQRRHHDHEWCTIAWTPNRFDADDIAAAWLAKFDSPAAVRIWFGDQLVAVYDRKSHPGTKWPGAWIADVTAYMAASGWTPDEEPDDDLWRCGDDLITVPRDDVDRPAVTKVIEQLCLFEARSAGSVVTSIKERAR